MIDIVIDTCTLVHADNPDSKYFEHSVSFIEKMLNNQVNCVVDEEFTLDETSNKSYIGLEYLKHLQPGSMGYNLILTLALNDRMGFVSNRIPQKHKRHIEQIIKNKKDRCFLRVAYNSIEKTLASHDFTDYQKAKRKNIKKEINVSIVTAEEIVEKL
jgi:hypothetical protein